MSCKDLRKCILFKLINTLNPIGSMISFMKPNFNLCMEEHLTIIKKKRDKHVTLMNKHLDIFRGCRHKTTFHQFFLIADYPVNE